MLRRRQIRSFCCFVSFLLCRNSVLFSFFPDNTGQQSHVMLWRVGWPTRTCLYTYSGFTHWAVYICSNSERHVWLVVSQINQRALLSASCSQMALRQVQVVWILSIITAINLQTTRATSDDDFLIKCIKTLCVFILQIQKQSLALIL